VETRYIYDPWGNLLAEANASNQITRKYIYGKGLIALVTPTARYCYHFDATGHTIALTDMAGTVVNSYAYEPFGQILAEQETIAQPFKFVGAYGVMAEPSGLYYMRARYYDPSVGRFISEDPIGFAGGDVNLSAYVGGNPLNRIDPSGLWGEDIHSGIGNSQYGTYAWARQAGFTDYAAQMIAYANNAVDEVAWAGWYPGFGDQSRHFNQSACGDSRANWSNLEFDRAIAAYNSGNFEAALGHIGKGLHSIQDYFAHGDWDTGAFGTNWHPSWYDDWNDRRNMKARERTELATKEYLRNFLKAIRY